MCDGERDSGGQAGSNFSTRIEGIREEPLRTGPELAFRFSQLWQESAEPPDVFRFLLAESPKPSLEEVLRTVHVDQRERWSRGLGRPVETYWNFLRVQFRDDSGPALWELVAAEWQLSREFAEARAEPSLADLQDRFPNLRERLNAEFGEVVDQDATRDLGNHGESTESIGISPALEVTEPFSPAFSGAPVKDVDSTTIEFEDEESTLSASEFMIEHDPESILGRCSPFSQLPRSWFKKSNQSCSRLSFRPASF